MRNREPSVRRRGKRASPRETDARERQGGRVPSDSQRRPSSRVCSERKSRKGPPSAASSGWPPPLGGDPQAEGNALTSSLKHVRVCAFLFLEPKFRETTLTLPASDSLSCWLCYPFNSKGFREENVWLGSHK